MPRSIPSFLALGAGILVIGAVLGTLGHGETTLELDAVSFVLK